GDGLEGEAMRRFQPAILALMLGAACAPARTGSVSGSASPAMAEDGVGSADAAASGDPAPAADAPAPEATATAAQDAPWVAVQSVDVATDGAGRRVRI